VLTPCDAAIALHACACVRVMQPAVPLPALDPLVQRAREVPEADAFNRDTVQRRRGLPGALGPSNLELGGRNVHGRTSMHAHGL
jgi:hypothetical protein